MKTTLSISAADAGVRNGVDGVTGNPLGANWTPP